MKSFQHGILESSGYGVRCTFITYGDRETFPYKENTSRDEIITDLGKDGWEMVALWSAADCSTMKFYFKREVAE